MSLLQLSVVLIAVMCVLNAIGVIALIRQVGLLHLRIKPVPAMEHELGPAKGFPLVLPAELSSLATRLAARYVVAFVSPTCRVCGPLVPILGHLNRSLPGDMGLLLVLDASEERATEYLTGKGVRLPFVANSTAFTTNQVPGAPWALITDSDGVVLAGGAVNTLEQIELLIDSADKTTVQPDSAPAVGALQIHHAEA